MLATLTRLGLALLLVVGLLPVGLAEDKEGGKKEKVIRPFNGKNLDGWKARGDAEGHGKWVVGVAAVKDDDPRRLVAKDVPRGSDVAGQMVNAIPRGDHGRDIYTEATFGDCIITLEFLVPRGSNSGIYVMGEYEVQVLDSYVPPGKKQRPLRKGDLGGIYGVAAPSVNAAKAPGEWQKVMIDFTAPRFDDQGKKTANARFNKVVINGKTVHEDVEVPGSTGGSLPGGEKARGPLMFQGNHGPVAYRKIQIQPK